jgi:signal transduction histidine kinase
VDVQALLRGMIESYPAFQPPEVEIRIEGPLPRMLGNEAALTQCFSNLMGNAVKFVAAGTRPLVRIWAEPPKADSATADDSPPATSHPPLPAVRLWFADNGIGIPKEAQERIFKMFQRLDKSYDGTGVGLTVVRKAVEKMGGRVGLESEPGRGSRFWVELKAAGDPSGAASPVLPKQA